MEVHRSKLSIAENQSKLTHLTNTILRSTTSSAVLGTGEERTQDSNLMEKWWQQGQAQLCGARGKSQLLR